MPRRDGQPTAEDLARAQQRGQGPPPPPPPGSGPPLEAVAAAALTATSSAVASARVVSGTAAAESAAAQALANAAAGILGAFDRFLAVRIEAVRTDLETTLVQERPGLSLEERLAIVAEEIQRERLFAAKARERLAADLPAALRVQDPTARADAVNALLERERRFVQQREQAVRERVIGRAHASTIRSASPQGAYWRVHIDERTCPQCMAMGGKVWPWSVLDLYKPPLHPNCQCSLWTIAEAERMGWITPADYATRDDMPGGDIMESVAELLDVDPDELDDALALLEARYDTRFARGTTKAGEFRPRRGGVAAPRIPRGLRTHRRSPSPKRVSALDHELDIRDLKTAELKPGDRIVVNGDVDEITAVRSRGLLVLKDSGLVYIDRDTVRGIPGETKPEPAPKPEPPPPLPTAQVAHDDVLGLAKAKRPSEAGRLLEGFHYDPELSRSETRDGELHLPPGFFKQSRAIREKVLFRHLGAKLADGLGDSGLHGLHEQDGHLSSRKAIVDTYYALNSPVRDRIVELHPDAARLVATAAHEKGLPLHPDAAGLITRPAAVDTPAPQHPAHALAERLKTEKPRAGLLAEAGYLFAGGDHRGAAFVNHDQGARILFDPNADEIHPTVEVFGDTKPHDGTADLKGTPGDVSAALHGLGFQTETRIGEWSEFVHPDGRATAVKWSDPNEEKMRAAAVRSFPPLADDVERAKKLLAGQAAREEQRRKVEAEAEARRLRDEEARARGETTQARVEQAIADGDEGKLTDALKGMKAYDAVVLLRKMGWEVRGKRTARSKDRSDRTISYRLRGPNGESARVIAGHMFSDQMVRSVELKAAPQQSRERIRRVWKDRKELYTDALGRSDQLAQRHGAIAHVTGIFDEGAGRGAAAHHEWNGAIVMGTGSGFKRNFDAFLKKRRSGGEITDAEHLSFYDGMTTLQHEINHGVGKAGDGPGGLAFGPQDYRTSHGKAMEEALTEETARYLTIDWLRENGMSDTLAALKRHPSHRSLDGSYGPYRARLKAAFDQAGVPAEDRMALMLRMKFEMTPAERTQHLGELMGGDAETGRRAMTSGGRNAWKRDDWQVAPDDPLGDVEAGPSRVDIHDGTVTGGERVEVSVGAGLVGGNVLEIDVTGNRVKVATDDGVELWYRASQMRRERA